MEYLTNTSTPQKKVNKETLIENVFPKKGMIANKYISSIGKCGISGTHRTRSSAGCFTCLEYVDIAVMACKNASFDLSSCNEYSDSLH